MRLSFILIFPCQELYQTLDAARPNLVRLARETDESDNDGISESIRIAFFGQSSLQKRCIVLLHFCANPKFNLSLFL